MPKLKTRRPKHADLSQLRIIGGQFKRRKLNFVAAEGLRPTPDRVRETIFNWLMGDIVNATILDMCAGSGVMGFECLSRGATTAVLIEPNKVQVKLLKEHANTFLINDKIQIHQGLAQDILPTLQLVFDIVFIDPPYSLNLWQTLLDGLSQYQLTHQHSLIYLEGDRPLTAMINNSDRYEIIKAHQFGAIWAYILKTRP